jgi:hypothetical protein
MNKPNCCKECDKYYPHTLGSHSEPPSDNEEQCFCGVGCKNVNCNCHKSDAKCPDCGESHDPRYTEHKRKSSEGELTVESLEKEYYGIGYSKGYIDGYKKGKEEGKTIFE